MTQSNLHKLSFPRLGLFSSEPEPDWRSVVDVEKYLEEIGEPANQKYSGRENVARARLYHEGLAQKSIKYFGGDFIAESYGPLSWEDGFKSLKEARKRNVDVKILCHFDQSSPQIVHIVDEYLGAGINLRDWGGHVRGGIYDETVMYTVQRGIKIPVNDLSDRNIEKLTPKVVGKAQSDKDVPLEILLTMSETAVKKFNNLFNKEFKKSGSMVDELKRLQEWNYKISTNELIGTEQPQFLL